MKSLACGELKSITTLGKLGKSESQSRNPCTGKGRRGGHEWAAIGPLPLPVSDSCLRRIFRWRVPPNWSVSDWRNEMRAEAACAAWQAVCDYDPSLGVPFSAFAHQRVLTGTLTRCRQEWAYALRLAPEYDPESSDSRRWIALLPQRSTPAQDML